MAFKLGSDVIAFGKIDTGGQSAGNGGDGHNSGYIINQPSLKFAPSNKADVDVSVKTGDHVDQKAYWDAGGAKGGDASVKVKKAGADDVTAKANATAESSGDQSSKSGHDTSKVETETTAKQINKLHVDQSQMVSAGNGGDGGHDNYAKGGDVEFALMHTNPTTETVDLKDVLNDAHHFDIDGFVHI